MPDERFQALARYLVDCGIDPKFAARIGAELTDHYADLEREALAANRTAEEAAAEAKLRIGDDSVIAREFVRRPELRAWIYRSAWFLRGVSLFASILVALLSTLSMPVQALVDRSPVLFRYGMAAAAAFVVTVVLLLGLQLATRYSPVTPEQPQFVRVALTESGTAVIIEELVSVDTRAMPQRPGGNRRPGQPADYQFQILADTSRAVDLRPNAIDFAPRGLADDEYVPIVKVAPIYPALAASQGLEGYVVVEFTVTPAGTVRDVVVIESSNELFHQAAIEATHKFKYKPRVVSGRPVEVPGVRNKITFVVEA